MSKKRDEKGKKVFNVNRKSFFVAGCIVMALAVATMTVLTLNDILALRGGEAPGAASGEKYGDEAGSATGRPNAGEAPGGIGATSGRVYGNAPGQATGGDGETAGQPDERPVGQAVRTAADGNWGLSFQNEGSPPVANATGEYLKQFNAYYIGDTGSKEKPVYLTFDAGYENGYTEGILDVLKEEKVPAAFFVVGNYIEENPELTKRMAAEGHIVGNHTMHHPDMSAISDEAGFRKEMSELEEAYKKAVGQDMLKFYRPPQGKYSESNLKMASNMGYTTVFWSLAYVDWLQDNQPAKEDALDILNRRIHPGAIVLLHSTSKTNAEILQELIQGWKAEGYTFKSISELGACKL